MLVTFSIVRKILTNKICFSIFSVLTSDVFLFIFFVLNVLNSYLNDVYTKIIGQPASKFTFIAR